MKFCFKDFFRKCEPIGRNYISSVIRQMGVSQNGCFKKETHATCVCVSGGKKCLFFGNFGVLETPVLRFTLLPYYRQFVKEIFE